MRLLALLLVALVLGCSGQVTFSRDWNAGKRGGPETLPVSDCKGALKSAATVCHMLLDELRQLVSCESRAMVRILQADDIETNAGPIFNGRR